MRKIINIKLWVETNDSTCQNDDFILKDISEELGYCVNNYDIVNFETMEIANERMMPDDMLAKTGSL